MKIIETLKPIRVYAIFCAAVLIAYVWAGLLGHKLAGDDNESKSDAPVGSRTHSSRSHYYHK